MSDLQITIHDVDFHGSEDGEFISFKGKKGSKIKYMLFEGSYYFPLFKFSVLKQIKTFKMRPDDILLAAYPRTGTHWMFEMVGMLLNGKAETVPKWKGKDSLEFCTSEEMSGLPSPRFLNTHMKLSNCPRELKDKKSKIIYNIRDPRDVIVSYYVIVRAVEVNEFLGDFEEYLYFFLDGKVECGGIFEHYQDADKFLTENPDIPVHFQIYEETQKNPVLEVQKLSDFLGLKRDDALCQAISDKCSFTKMAVDKDQYTFKAKGENVIYRKGVVGDWKNWFTDQMLEDYYRVYEEKLKGTRFYERYARQK